MNQNPYIAFSGITYQEMAFLQKGTAELDDKQKTQFFLIYGSKRKSPQDLLIYTLFGLVGIAGIQRFAVRQTLMGLLYFITAGFCYIGTIVDLVNYKSLADDYNYQMAYESFQAVKMGH